MSPASFEWVELADGSRALLIRDSDGHELLLSEAEAQALARVLPHLQEFLC